MNSEGKIGVLIKWLTPVEIRDYSNLKEGDNGDFVIQNYHKVCPVTDGSPVTFEDVDGDYEWLLYATKGAVSGYDPKLFKELQYMYPTSQKDTELLNYNLFICENKLVRRSVQELVATIRQLENDANLSVQGESEKSKMAMMIPAVLVKVSTSVLLNSSDQAVYDRMMEVADKANRNAANADFLIEQVNNGETPDLNSGWEYDNITPQGFPFSA